jgi:hypothetical protein
MKTRWPVADCALGDLFRPESLAERCARCWITTTSLLNYYKAEPVDLQQNTGRLLGLG